MTFSIVGCSEDGASWGVAVASKFLAVGNAVPAARAGVGAIATQAAANVAWKVEALALLAAGRGADQVIAELTANDAESAHRQVGVVDREGRGASYTGEECLAWAGSYAADGVAIQGNVLVGPEVIDAVREAWEAGGNKKLAHRLLDALAAGDAAGGDRRGRQSAALLVVQDGAGYGGLDDIVADLRVDDAEAPIPELQRLLELNDFYLTAPETSERLPVDADLRGELEERAAALGQESFLTWVGCENYEMRVAPDVSWIDQRVLAILREA